MKTNFYLYSILLMAFMFTSCDNKKQKLANEWELYYLEKLSSVSDKIGFINEKQSEVDSYDECNVYDMENVTLWTLLVLDNDVVENNSRVKIDNEKVCILHASAEKEYGFSSTEMINKLNSINEIDALDTDQKVKEIQYDIDNNKSTLHSLLEKFDSLKYLVVVKDQTLVKPESEKNTFVIGYLNSHIEVYDMSDFSMVDDHYLTVENDDEVETYSVQGKTVNWTNVIHKNLYRNMEYAVQNHLVEVFPELEEIVPKVY